MGLVGGTDYLFKFRLPNGNAYLQAANLANLYVSIIGASGTLYDKYCLNVKEGYLKIKADGDWFMIYIVTQKTIQIANSGDSVKAQINIIQNEADTTLIPDGKINTVLYIDLPEFTKPLVEVEPA